MAGQKEPVAKSKAERSDLLTKYAAAETSLTQISYVAIIYEQVEYAFKHVE